LIGKALLRLLRRHAAHLDELHQARFLPEGGDRLRRAKRLKLLLFGGAHRLELSEPILLRAQKSDR
jgi:hypothetical protein